MLFTLLVVNLSFFLFHFQAILLVFHHSHDFARLEALCPLGDTNVGDEEVKVDSIGGGDDGGDLHDGGDYDDNCDDDHDDYG